MRLSLCRGQYEVRRSDRLGQRCNSAPHLGEQQDVLKRFPFETSAADSDYRRRKRMSAEDGHKGERLRRPDADHNDIAIRPVHGGIGKRRRFDKDDFDSNMYQSAEFGSESLVRINRHNPQSGVALTHVLPQPANNASFPTLTQRLTGAS